MNTAQEHPSITFRKQYRDEWAKFLSSNAGLMLKQVYASQIPSALPDSLPHKEHGRLGQILQWQMTFNLLFGQLLAPPESGPSIPQNYNFDEESKNT